MANNMNNKSDTQSVRIAQDLKKHNWLLSKFRHRQDISITENIRHKVPPSPSLNRLPQNTTTIMLNNKSAIPPQKEENLSQNYLWNTTNRVIASEMVEQQSIKHNLPIQAVPNRDKYFASSRTIGIQNGIEKRSAATQTKEIKILSDEEYRLYEKSKQVMSVDVSNNLPTMENNQLDAATTYRNGQESQESRNHIVIDEQSMSEIQSTSDEYKNLILNFISTLNETKENVAGTNLEKKESLFKMIKILIKTYNDSKNKAAERLSRRNSMTNNPAGIQMQNIQEQLQLRQQLMQTAIQQANASQQIVRNNQLEYNMNNNFQEPHSNLTQTITYYPSNDQRVQENYNPTQNREELIGQYDSQRYNYMQMVQRSRAQTAAMVRSDNNAAIPQTLNRFAQKGWPYPRQDTIRDSMQSQETKHQRHMHMHTPQVYYPQHTLQHQYPNHNDQLPMQQQVMYNNIYI